MSEWLKEMVVLGQGAPNKSQKLGGRQGRCLCLWSNATGYCRVYPIPYGYVKDWQIIDVLVRQSANDGRENSYVIDQYEKTWPNLSRQIVPRRQLNRIESIELLKALAKDNFANIRDNRHSFGIIKPSSFELKLEKNLDKSIAQTRLSYFEQENDNDLIMDQNDYAWLPYIFYSCECTVKHPHTSKLVEWGAYQWMKKNPNNYDHCVKLLENFHINDAQYEHFLLIGNLKRYPRTYVVVKLFRFKI
jgi:hypothetical protein